MIKVLQVYDSLAISSGISSVLISWIKNMDDSKIKSDFLCCWNKKPSYDTIIQNKGSKVYYIEDGEQISDYFGFIKKVKLFMKEHAKEYDIIHLHSSIFSFPILYYAKKFHLKHRVVHVHSAALGSSTISKYRNTIFLLPMKFLSTNFVACSQEAAEVWYEKINIKDYKIINNGIDVESFKDNNYYRNKIRSIWGVEDGTILLGHISNMSPIKNVQFIIKVLRKLIDKGLDYKLVLIGREVLPTELSELIKQLNLKDYIINAGISDKIPNVIQAIDIGVMPSISEGYGLVPLEFQAASIPILISKGFPSIISITPYAMQIELDIDKWIYKIISLKNSKQINYDNNGIYNFDISNIANSVYDYYCHILKND